METSDFIAYAIMLLTGLQIGLFLASAPKITLFIVAGVTVTLAAIYIIINRRNRE